MQNCWSRTQVSQQSSSAWNERNWSELESLSIVAQPLIHSMEIMKHPTFGLAVANQVEAAVWPSPKPRLSECLFFTFIILWLMQMRNWIVHPSSLYTLQVLKAVDYNPRLWPIHSLDGTKLQHLLFSVSRNSPRKLWRIFIYSVIMYLYVHSSHYSTVPVYVLNAYWNASVGAEFNHGKSRVHHHHTKDQPTKL